MTLVVPPASRREIEVREYPPSVQPADYLLEPIFRGIFISQLLQRLLAMDYETLVKAGVGERHLSFHHLICNFVSTEDHSFVADLGFAVRGGEEFQFPSFFGKFIDELVQHLGRMNPKAEDLTQYFTTRRRQSERCQVCNTKVSTGEPFDVRILELFGPNDESVESLLSGMLTQMYTRDCETCLKLTAHCTQTEISLPSVLIVNRPVSSRRTGASMSPTLDLRSILSDDSKPFPNYSLVAAFGYGKFPHPWKEEQFENRPYSWRLKNSGWVLQSSSLSAGDETVVTAGPYYPGAGKVLLVYRRADCVQDDAHLVAKAKQFFFDR
jgi:hypothetical protein